MPDLRSLNKQEHQLRRSLEGIGDFIHKFDPKRDLRQVNVRLEALERIFNQFVEVRMQIELLLEDALELDGDEETLQQENDKIRQDFENNFYSLKSELLAFKSEGISKNSTLQTPDAQAAGFAKVKLPEIKLPSFSGKIHEWVPYRDSFRSLIHVNTLLSDVDKFTYLRSSLSGDALQEINSIDLSAVNYAVAWKALESRYENKKLIVKAHLDALFAVEPLKKESYDGLNQLIGVFEKNLQMLEKIGEKPSDWSTILAYMVCSRLDMATLRHWETHHNSKDVAKYSTMIDFLKRHCSVLQSIASSKSANSPEQRQFRSAVCHTTFKSTPKCHFCSEPRHSVFMCVSFQQMSVPERIEAANRNKLCRNCLYPGHFARTCERGTCRQCHQKHHTLLHTEQPRFFVPPTQSRPPAVNQYPRQPQFNPPSPNQQTRNANTAKTHDSHIQPATEHTTTSQTHVALPTTPTQNVLLATVLVSIQDRYRKPVQARALLDSCSQHCLMTKGFASKLKLDETPVYLSIQGIGSSQAESTKVVTAVVSPRSPNVSSFAKEISFHVLPKLTESLPSTSISIATWNLPNSAYLADPKFFEMGPIDIIIGAEYYMELLKEERRRATKDGPTLQNTVFGWIVSGRIPEGPAASYSLTHVCTTAESQIQLSRFWEEETCQSTSTLSVEESTCEEFFDRTIHRNDEATKCLQHVSDEGKDDIEERKQLGSQMDDLLQSAGFFLRKSNSNSKGMLSAVPEGFRNGRWKEESITSKEYAEAIKELVKLSYLVNFSHEVGDHAKYSQVQDSSRIPTPNPQIVGGILCVGGRLKNTTVPYSRKYPYILDHRQPFARILVVHYHQKCFHVDQQQTVSAVRKQSWSTSTRNLAKQKVGVQKRQARPIKFFMAVTEAVHLEIAADLLTQAILVTLPRFTACRGKPSLFMYDNATNFVGIRRKLDELAQLFASQKLTKSVLHQTIEDRIEFRFILAQSLNIGALWEGSFKTLCKRIIGRRSLECDTMQTVLAQAEAILNSRPLTPISNDPDDFEVITLGHFLIQRHLTVIPGPDLSEAPENRLSAWQRMANFNQRLWKNWSEQYLHNRTKWTRQGDNIVVGTMVVIKEENLLPLKWQLVRVTRIYPVSDRNVRVVTVWIKDGSYYRAISKICNVPIRDNFSAKDGENQDSSYGGGRKTPATPVKLCIS